MKAYYLAVWAAISLCFTSCGRTSYNYSAGLCYSVEAGVATVDAADALCDALGMRGVVVHAKVARGHLDETAQGVGAVGHLDEYLVWLGRRSGSTWRAVDGVIIVLPEGADLPFPDCVVDEGLVREIAKVDQDQREWLLEPNVGCASGGRLELLVSLGGLFVGGNVTVEEGQDAVVGHFRSRSLNNAEALACLAAVTGTELELDEAGVRLVAAKAEK